MITALPGVSAYFPGGVVSYSNMAKQELLGSPPRLLEAHGAVSAEVAEAMAAAVRDRFHATLGLSVTGIAGPTGDHPRSPSVSSTSDSQPPTARFNLGNSRSGKNSRVT